MTNKSTDINSSDNWYNAAVKLLALTLILYFIGLSHSATVGGMSGGLQRLVVFTGVMFGGGLTALLGLISFVKNGRKTRSLGIIFFSIIIAFSPFILIEFGKSQDAKRTQEAINARTPTDWLYYLCKDDLDKPEVQQQFISYLNQGADINAIKFGYLDTTVIYYCIGEDAKPEAIDFLVKHGAKINLEPPSQLLHQAIYRANVGIVETLLDYGVGVNEENILFAKEKLVDSNKFNPAWAKEDYKNRYEKIILLLQAKIIQDVKKVPK